VPSLGATIDRPHVWQPAAQNVAGARTILLLHGMGADEHDLLALGRLLDPAANLLSPRGLVNPDGLNRFFMRHADGTFDEAGIALAADELADFLVAASERYGFNPSKVWAAGFSNGANTCVALIQRHPEALQGVSAYSVTKQLAVDVFDAAIRSLPASSLSGKKVFIANGAIDPHAPLSEARELTRQLSELGAQVELLEHSGGHTIVMEHVRPVITYLAAN